MTQPFSFWGEMKLRCAVFIVIGLIWGSAWIAASVVVRPGLGLQAGAVRFAIAAIFAGVLAIAARWHKPMPDGKRLFPDAPVVVASLVLGVTMVGLPYALGVWAAGQVSPGVVATLYATMPLVTLFLCGPGNSAEIPKLVIGMCGVMVLVAQGLLLSAAQIKGGALLAASVALQAWSFVYARKRLRKGSLLASSAIQLMAAALLTGLLSAATERFAMNLSGQNLALLLALAIGVSGVTLPLLYWLLSEMRPWRAAALQWVTTLVAVVEAGWFLRAQPSVEMWVGAAMIVTTVTWLLLGSRSEAVTLQITNEPIGRSNASLSEVD